MNNLKINEWQEMALKKDTEAILKKIVSNEPVFLSLSWEIIIAVGSIIIDHLFDIESVSIYIWYFCFAAAIIPPILILFFRAKKWIDSVERVRAGKLSIRKFIDTFDNQICYCVMTSNSYCNLLESLPEEKKIEKVFLFQEGSYYNNRSIQELCRMQPVISKVFSDNQATVFKDNLVSLSRLLSMLEMMNECQLKLDRNIADQKDCSIVQDQVTINNKFYERIKAFIDEMNDSFSKKFEWQRSDSLQP